MLFCLKHAVLICEPLKPPVFCVMGHQSTAVKPDPCQQERSTQPLS